MKFKLLAGLHAGHVGTPAVGVPGMPGYKEASKDYKKITYDARDPKNNIIESDVDLVKKFGADKYQRLDGGGEAEGARASAKTKAAAAPPVKSGPSREELEEMTVAELKQHAENNEIDLGHATKKEEIINTILSENPA